MEELMASTRTPGITTSIDGRRFIDKRYRGVRIGMPSNPCPGREAVAMKLLM
jgi:hypothetical protein